MEMVLKELLDLTPEGAEILRRLHIDPKDVGAIGLPEFLRRVAKLSKEQLQEVFGTEYWSKIGELTGSSDIEAIGELHRNLTTDMEGTIQAMADLKNQGAPGAWEDLKSAINALNVSLGKAGILFLLEHAFNALRKFIDAITNAPGPVRTVIAAIISMGPALLAIGAGLKLVTFGLSGLVPLLKAAAWANKQFGISTTFAAIANSKFVVSLKATRIGMLLTGATARVMWASITGPIGIAVALIGILVYKFRRQILGALKTVWKWVKGNWPLLVGILLGPFGIAGALIWKFRRQIFGVFTSIKKFFARVWGSIVGIFQDHWDKALAILFPAVGLPLLIARNWGRIVDAVDGVWSRVNNTVRGWIDAMVAFISELPGRVLDIVKDIPGMVADAIRDIPGLGGAIKVFTGLSDKVGGFFGKEKENFDKGGIVPGPTGRPMLATVHGGEMIIPPSAGQMLLDMFQGFKLGAAGLPTPSPGAATIYRQSISNRPTVNMGDITINITTSPGADSGEIAEDVAQNIADAVDKAIGKTFRDIAHDFDGPIER